MSDAPQKLSARPDLRHRVAIDTDANDPLSDALHALGLRGRVFCRSILKAPWALAAPPGDFAHFHVVSDGQAWLHVPTQREPARLQAGDLVVLPRGTGHLLSDARDPPSTHVIDLGRLTPKAGMNCVTSGGKGPAAQILCGSFDAGRGAGASLLGQLPDVLHVRGRAGQAPDWLAEITGPLTNEATRPALGRSAVMTRLTDVLMLRVLRYWLEQSPNRGSWLVAMQDDRIGAVLSLVGHDLGQRWTVAALARHVAMSRSAFAARFRELVGEPPLSYIARVRLDRGARLLRTSDSPIESIATSLGYATAAAFHKAFKRRFGMTPGSYRRRS